MSETLAHSPISSTVAAGMLPTPVTPLFGRSREIAAVQAILDTGDIRLVTVTGAGGIGKTRLALEAARVMAGDFAQGARFVALAPVQDPELVPATVAHVFGIKVQGSLSTAEALGTLLRDQHLLLVLDNLEHLAPGLAPWLAGLLAACPRLHVLATSRVSLRISGEQRYPLEPLALPERTLDAAPERVAESGAVQLFVQRARAVRPDVTLDAGNAEDIAEICRVLDGVPLAIELAAARVAAMPLSALRERLASRLQFLTGGHRDAPARHQTMRDAIAWSYALLSEPEQRAFRRLAVFRGGFTLDAAAAVAAREDREASMLDVLERLVDHSLLRFEPDTGGDGRYRQLETIREYGLECLAASGEEPAARDAHAAFFRCQVAVLQDAVREAEPNERGARLAAFLDRLEAERGNLRAALAWWTEQARIEEALALAVALWPFRTSHGHDLEAYSTIEALLAHPGAGEKTVATAHALHAVAHYARRLGHLARSIEASEEALTIFREAGDDRHAGHAYLSLAWAHMDAGPTGKAIGHYRKSLRLARMTHDVEGSAAALDLLGWLHAERDELKVAIPMLDEALTLSRISGDRMRLANVLCHAGLVAARQGDASRADEHFRESVAIARDVGDVHVLPCALTALAATMRREGDIDGAEACELEALQTCRTSGYTHGQAFALASLAKLALDRGQHARAVGYLRDSIAAYERVGLRFGMQYCAAFCFDSFACLALDAGDRPAAARFIGMADALYDRTGIARLKGDPILDLPGVATVRSMLSEPELAREWRAGYALPESAMAEEALAFALPASMAAPHERAPVAARDDLTARELEVLRLLADGLTNREIADTLFVGQRTVATHVASILGKLSLSSRTGAVAYAIRHGLA